MQNTDYQKLFNELPKDVQVRLASPEISEQIYDFGKSISLEDEEISLVAESIGDVVMGVVKEDGLTKNLAGLRRDELTIDKLIMFSKDTVREIKAGNSPTATPIQKGVATMKP